MKYLSIVAYALLLLSCYGWGHILTRKAAWSDTNQFAFTAVVGMACLTFIGGVMNLARIAFPIVLDMLLLAGLVFFILASKDRSHTWLNLRRGADAAFKPAVPGMALDFLPLAILAVAVGYYAFTLLSTVAFNPQDDFYTYVLRPVRMLQTGTVSGNPYEILGLDSLGANAFLQSFVLLAFPVEFLPGFDSVFSFSVAGLLLLELCRKFDLHWIYSVLVILVFMVVNPQIVNISAVYIGVVFILGVFFSSWLLLEQIDGLHGSSQKVAAAISGLVYAGLISLKATFAPFSIVFFLIFFTGLLWLHPDKRNVLKLCGVTLLSIFAGLLPWLVQFADKYAAVINLKLHPPAPTAEEGHFFQGQISSLLSDKESYFGGVYFNYSFIVIILAGIALYSFMALLREKGSLAQRRYLLVALAACLACVSTYLFNGAHFNAQSALRYFCPMLIATFPVALLALSVSLPEPFRLSGLLNYSGLKSAAVLAVSIVVTVMFWDNFKSRLDQAYSQHTLISFPLDEEFWAYDRYAVSPDAERTVREIQDKTAAGEKMFAFISLPMHLDFNRNEIYTLREVALLSPWLDLPYAGNVTDMVHYLKGQGVRYVMWEYIGHTVLSDEMLRDMQKYYFESYRKVGRRGLHLRQMLAEMLQADAVVYYSNKFAVIDLQKIR